MSCRDDIRSAFSGTARRAARAGYAVLLAAGLAALPVCVPGCGGNKTIDGSVYERLQHEDPSVRINAVMEAAETNGDNAVPLLVDRLTDQEVMVQVFSARALRRITGQDFGWNAWESFENREAAVEKWRDWVKGRKPGKGGISSADAENESRSRAQ